MLRQFIKPRSGPLQWFWKRTHFKGFAHAGMNVFTNYFNDIAGTVVVFPLVDTKKSSAAA